MFAAGQFCGDYGADGPAVLAVVAFAPPAVGYAQVHAAVDGQFHAAGARSLVGASGSIEPDVAALGEQAGNGQTVIFHKEDAAQEAFVAADVQHLLNEVDAGLVRRVGLAGKDQNDGAVGLAHDAEQTFQVCKDECGAFVGGKTPGKADNQGFGGKQVLHAFALGRGEVEELSKVGDAAAQGFQQGFLLVHARGPVNVVGYLVHAVPDRVFGRGLQPVGAQVLQQQLVHPAAHVRGRVHAVGHVADGGFGQGQAFPEIVPHVAGNHAVQAAHAVGPAGEAQGQDGHFKGAAVSALYLPQLRELRPGEPQADGHAVEVALHELQGEGFVACGHGGVGGEEGVGSHALQGLGKGHA